MYPDANGAHMGALSHFVLSALMRKMVERGLLSDSDVGAIYQDAAGNLRSYGQSEARVALSALENKIIPNLTKRTVTPNATKTATISNVTKLSDREPRRDSVAAYVFWLFIVLAVFSIAGGIAMGFSPTAKGSDGVLITVLKFFITAGLFVLSGYGAKQLIRSKPQG